jgi:type III pantothenate kinase
MVNLLIDIGNSNIKTALSSGSGIFKIRNLAYSKNYFEYCFKKIISYEKGSFDYIGISCLNKKYNSYIKKTIRHKFSITPFFVGPDKALPIKLKYEKSLGNDRICSASAAAIKFKGRKNILVIDFGTATTYNLIVNNIFQGGLITPGIGTSLLSLNINANLPVAGIKNIGKLISSKTEENILSGVIHQSLFATEGIIRALRKDYSRLFVVSTGGFAELITKKTRLIDITEKYLVFEGINVILNHNLKFS